jgi:hypothetical protein
MKMIVLELVGGLVVAALLFLGWVKAIEMFKNRKSKRNK